MDSFTGVFMFLFLFCCKQPSVCCKDVAEVPIVVETSLPEKVFDISLNVQPSTSKIFFDGQEQTTSIIRTKNGIHELKIEQEGFHTVEQSIEIFENGKNVFDIALEPIMFSVFFSIQDAGAISITNESGKSWEVPNFSQTSLPWGIYSFETKRERSVQSKKKKRKKQKHEPDILQWNQKIDADQRVNRCFDNDEQYLRCVWHLKCGGAPKAVEFSPDGKELWVALLMGPMAVEVYDTQTWEKIKSINLEDKGAVEFVFSPDGSKVYASQMQTSSVYEIDSKTKELIRKMNTKGLWTKVLTMNTDGNRLFASNWVSNDVSEFELPSGIMHKKWKTSKTPRGLYITKDNKHLYVATYEGGTLERFDLEKGTKTILFSEGRSMRHIVADEENALLYISDMGRNVIWKHNIVTGETMILTKTESHPNTIRLSHDNRLLFVSIRGQNNPKSYIIPGPEYGVIQVFDTKTGALLDVAIGGNQPTALDLSSTNLLASSDFLDANINIYMVSDSSLFLERPSNRTENYKIYMKK